MNLVQNSKLSLIFIYYLVWDNLRQCKLLHCVAMRLYKYIINIEGHTIAYRLSLELSMGSVILLVDCENKLLTNLL